MRAKFPSHLSTKLFALVMVGLFAAAVFGTRANATQTLQLGGTVSLGLLIDQGYSVQVGDKIFDDFTWTSPDFDYSTVTAVAIETAYGYGLSFQDEWSSLDGAGFVLSFSVSVAPEATDWYITDVHLGFNGNAVGEAYAEITEQVFASNGVLIGTLQGSLFVTTPDTPEDSLLFDPLKKIYVQKDVQLYGGDIDNRATISVINQSFSQIPEPSTALMVGAALFGLAATIRRRR